MMLWRNVVTPKDIQKSPKELWRDVTYTKDVQRHLDCSGEMGLSSKTPRETQSIPEHPREPKMLWQSWNYLGCSGEKSHFPDVLLTGIRCLSFFCVWRESADVSQCSSELTSEYLFDLTTSVAVPVPNTDEGNFACAVSCTQRATRSPTDGSSDNTFVGQNSSFFFFSLLLPSFFLFN